jgi:hypothetical protein
MLTGRHHFCHPMTHPVRNRIPCHHVHTLLGTFQVRLKSSKPRSTPHSSVISFSSKCLPSGSIYLLHTLFEKRKRKPNIGTWFRCQYEPRGPVIIQVTPIQVLLIDLHDTRSPRKRKKEKEKIDIRMLRI